MKGRFQQKHIENVLRRYEYSIQLPTLPFLSMVEVVVLIRSWNQNLSKVGPQNWNRKRNNRKTDFDFLVLYLLGCYLSVFLILGLFFSPPLLTLLNLIGIVLRLSSWDPSHRPLATTQEIITFQIFFPALLCVLCTSTKEPTVYVFLNKIAGFRKSSFITKMFYILFLIPSFEPQIVIKLLNNR